MAVLELRDLTKTFGPVTPVQAVSHVFPAGALTWIQGPSGSGKTTLLRLIAGLEHPSSGSVLCDGVFMSSGRVHVPPHRRRLAMSFQHMALWPNMHVTKHLDYVLRAHRTPRLARATRVQQLLQLLELDHRSRAWPATLSGGEQQRLNIARALAAAQPILLLDEPFAHLDGHLAEVVLTELLRLRQQEGTTILLVAHEEEMLAPHADNVLRLPA